jgi:hypothetical protein
MRNSRLLQSDGLRLSVLAGLAAGLGVGLLVTTDLIAKDGVFYIEQARQLLADPAGVARRHPPGYPALLWAAHRTVRLFARGDSALLWACSAQGVTLLCRLLALVPLYALGRRLVGPRDTFWGLLILILLPHPAHYGSDVLREWPYVLFLSLGFWLLYVGLQDGRGWTFALAGLAAGLGSLIRPECAQLLVFGLVGLPVLRIADCGLRIRDEGRATAERWRWGPGLALVVAWAGPVGLCCYATGTIVPTQLRSSVFNTPPVIVSVGTKTAGDLLEFEVRAGALLELPIEVFDAQNDPLTFSLVGVPVGSRPVYQFRSDTMGTRFWTISEQERDLLLTVYSRRVWDYEGIAHYVYAEPGAASGLQAVYRSWSPVRQRHFYTLRESEKASLARQSPQDSWQSEGVVFYAFPPESRPAESIPIYRFRSREGGYFWAMKKPSPLPQSAGEPPADEVAWYVQVAGAPPAGAALARAKDLPPVLRWRPGLDQTGEYQLNIIVSDGKAQSCQLVKVRVRGPASSLSPEPSREAGPRQYAGVAQLPTAAHSIFDALTEDLAGVFFVPWLLGLYGRLRSKAGHTEIRNSKFEFRNSDFGVSPIERVLVIALLVVNVGLMLGRHVWIAPGSDRRYSLGLLALTIFYVPAGLDMIAQWLNHLFSRRGSAADRGHSPSCFYLLMAIGVAVCITWLLLPPRADRTSYRTMARWLQQNTGTDDVIAVPDPRLSFYADRRGVVYDRHFDPRQVDYVVRIEDDKAQTPEDWQAEYTIPLEAHTAAADPRVRPRSGQPQGAAPALAAYKILRVKS